MLVSKEYEEQIANATRQAMARGSTVLQIFEFGNSEKEHLDKLCNWINPPAFAKILDVGCGVGVVSNALLEEYEDVDVTLLNNNEWQLNLCDDIHTKLYSDMHKVDLPDESFDVVMVNYAIGYADLPVALKEFYRLLVPGGKLFIVDVCGVSPMMKEHLNYYSYPTCVFEQYAASAGFNLQMRLHPKDASVRQFKRLLVGENQDTISDMDQILREIKPVVWSFFK